MRASAVRLLVFLASLAGYGCVRSSAHAPHHRVVRRGAGHAERRREGTFRCYRPDARDRHLSVNVPRQCDTYTQLSVRKVDILWVVDSSGSMEPKQQRLAANFQGFINQLVAANPPIDFHIAVTTTDTDDSARRAASCVRGRSAPCATTSSRARLT